jgi:hypothetical protein
METTVLIPIISAISALLGVALTASLQARSQTRNQQFQQGAESVKYRREQFSKEQEQTLQRIMTAHKLLSRVAREFSITNLDILWRSEITDGQYDIRYLTACAEVDELRALIALYEPQFSEDVEKIHGHMNLFWGNFKDVLYQTERGNPVDHRSPSLVNAHAAAEQIGKTAAFVKSRLADRTKELRRNFSTALQDVA